jgi:hypothetical protein
MAVSKNTRKALSETNQALRKILQNSKVNRGRERDWVHALQGTQTGCPPLRFPVYECLYRINVHAQGLVDALRDVCGKFDLGWHVYQEALVQYVRATATRSILTAMTEIEHTEAWLFETQRGLEEKKLVDHDDDEGDLLASDVEVMGESHETLPKAKPRSKRTQPKNSS